MLLEELCSLDGVSGQEDMVREYIIEQIQDDCSYRIDEMGNIIAFKKGKSTPQKKLLLSAHMDEVGLIVTSITEDGCLRFSPVGGIDPRVLIATRVKFLNGVKGVISAVPVHLLTPEERGKIPETQSLVIDIGAKDRQQAEQNIHPGDVAVFDSEFLQLGEETVKAKAIDDRFGCALLIELIKQELPWDVTFTFTVQEEVGLRGAKTAAYTVAPDYAIIVEATTAADVRGVPEEKQVCKLGGGGVVSFMDSRTYYSQRLYKMAFALAEKRGIPIQTKTVIAGGNDAGAIQQAGKGAEVIAVSLPCRYIHSPSCVVNRKDMEACAELVSALIHEIGAL